MTFFANSGITWPNLSVQTAEAGEAALTGASKMWAIFARMEAAGDESHSYDLEMDIQSAVEGFRESAKSYRNILEHVEGENVDQMSRAEIDLAAIDLDFIYNWRYYQRIMPADQFTHRDLYREMSIRLEALADALSGLKYSRPKTEIAGHVFRLMRDWEIISSLARAIAVINKRPHT